MRGEHKPFAMDPSVVGATELVRMLNSEAWKQFKAYLRVKRRGLAMQNCYKLNPQANMIEIARNQGALKLIDDILAETQDGAKILASRVTDSYGQEDGSPYGAE